MVEILVIRIGSDSVGSDSDELSSMFQCGCLRQYSDASLYLLIEMSDAPAGTAWAHTRRAYFRTPCSGFFEDSIQNSLSR